MQESRSVRETRQILFCGRVSVEKNLPLLVEAFKRLCLLRRDTALVVAGDGPYMQTMKRELQGLPAYFLGFQNDAQLAPLYASADLFVFPSRTDTAGNVVLEAQASGLPVVVADTGGPRESVLPGRTGLVVSGEEPETWVAAVASLVRRSDQRRQFSIAARAYASSRSWSEALAPLYDGREALGFTKLQEFRNDRGTLNAVVYRLPDRPTGGP